MPLVNSKARFLLSFGLMLPAFAAHAADLPPLPMAKEEVIIAQPHTSTVPAPPQMQQPQAEPLAGMGTSITLDALEQYRGGSAINSEAVSNGLLQDASATNVATGNNTIADGAFSHAMGLPIVIQNSGANVLIQNSTIVNVQFKP